MDTWLDYELALSQKHEEIVLKREALLRNSEGYYGIQRKHVSSYIGKIQHTQQKNNQLLKDIDLVLEKIEKDTDKSKTTKFENLKSNYRSMVKNVFIVWQEEYEGYRNKKKRFDNEKSRSLSPHVKNKWNYSGMKAPSPQRSISSPIHSQNFNKSMLNHKPRSSLKSSLVFS